MDALAPCGNHLLPNAANRQHVPGQGNFPGHRQSTAWRLLASK